MNEQIYEAAPLDAMAKGITLFSAVLMIGIGFMISNIGLMVSLLLLMGGITYLFSVKKYRISDKHITVIHPLWEKNWLMADLTDTSTPQMGISSIRLFGSGGLFGYLGWFRNRDLGNYLAYVTDRANMVGLHFGTRTVVISPADPLIFIDDVNAYIK